MSYRLEPDETLPDGIKRMAKEQIDQALEQFQECPAGRNEAVHDARKRFKKIRAILRLVRDEIGEEVYKLENVCFRDAGRRLADVRDSYVVVETVDDLSERFSDQLAANAFDVVRQSLLARHQQIIEQLLDEEGRMTEVAATIETARQRVEDWPVEQTDFAAIYGGLRRVYKRGRNRLAEAYAEPVPENFHDWRKRVKYLWYHTRILQPLWPDLLDELADQLHDLSDYLGDDHDLAELRQIITAQPEMFKDEQVLQVWVALIDRRRTELEAAARPLGERIYIEEPAEFVDRMAAYWPIWREQAGTADPIAAL
jgi:CHAD domain-containing protein